ncbi:type VI secretion system baseplate subunit TssF [Massilia sp. CF038]|uniref:type VI secretion system baseplate subunit TssF n=1 Tax=Massilia sp. CF038 TaxID=1881045 RepID=UPI000910382F|nr:type VI secretion system baseplate subunit TssF [Massilia sp. CF038]SHH10099.1 type VI secretion system protein ImpG [Massilia sp. CF038]
MSRSADDPLAYYRRELDYLRNAGREFARKHPEMAGRLELGGLESPDPHVERLIESFAFLTGRLRRDLDSEFPQIAGALLEALQPGFMAPLPAMTVVRFAPDLSQGLASARRTVARGTPLHAFGRRERTPDLADVPCQFRTCYPVDVWPIAVTEATMEDARLHPAIKERSDVTQVLRVRLQCSGTGFGRQEGQIAPDDLRFHLYGDWGQVNPLYDMLLCNLTEVQVVARGGFAAARGARIGWQEVGFGPDEALLPAAANGDPAYRLLQEYFCFPRKFMFFNASGFGTALDMLAPEPLRDCVELLILFSGQADQSMQIRASQFQLGCTPAVNLFERTSEAIRLDQRSVEYRLVADQRREASTEIHSVLALQAGYADGQRGKPLTAYALAAQLGAAAQAPFWVARRDHALAAGHSGTDMFLSFVGAVGIDGVAEAAPLISATVLCTNRDLAAAIRPDQIDTPPARACFQADASIGVLPAACLYQPTRQIAPPLDGESLWRLASLLNLNQLSLNHDPGQNDACAALQQLLDLCNSGDSVAGARQIRALKSVEYKSVVRAVRSGPAPGFRRGIELVLAFKRGDFSEGTPLMLAAVLQRFLPMYVSVNSFASVTVMDGLNKVKAWAPSIN